MHLEGFMKMKSMLLAVSMLATVALAGPGDETYIRTAHDQFAKAALSNSYKTMEKSIMQNMTADFKYKSPNGRSETRTQWLQMMKQEFQRGMKFSAFKFTVGKITVNGKTASVQSSLTAKGSGMGPDKKNHVFGSTSKAVETWVKEGSKWKIKMIDTKSEKMTMDGKPFDPSKMGGG
jgi:Tfp pilus assembly protein PilE